MCECCQGGEILNFTVWKLGNKNDIEIAAIIKKFSNILILSESISGEEFRIWRDFLAVFDIKSQGFPNSLQLLILL